MKTLAHGAGERMRAHRPGGQSVAGDYKNGHELVTRADIEVDEWICGMIRERFPGHAILAEETAPELQNLEELEAPLWIIDPIDGTVNYAHGHFQVAVSIAYVERGEILYGLVYNPFLDEMFCARKGEGATLNGERISVSREMDMRRSLVATGFPYQKEDMAPLFKRVEAVLTHCADIRRLGSAAMDICWLAAGRLDAYYESLSVWDFAAAQRIAIEAGAEYGHYHPVPAGVSPVFHNKHILVANPALFPKMQRLLRQATQ